MTRPLALLTAAVVLGGCANPMNLAYDFGRAYQGAFQTQAALDRPSVAAAQYRMSGMEGTIIRLRVEAEASDRASETTRSTRNQNIQ